MHLRYEDFFAYLKEREAIRLRRASNQPRPWTEDPILQEWKFTNVFRSDDRTTKFFVEHQYEPYRSDDRRSILMNCAINRWFGTTQMAHVRGWWDIEEYDPELLKKQARIVKLNFGKVFTGAYVISNFGGSGDKIDVIVDDVLTPFVKRISDLIELGMIQSGFRWRDMALAMRQCHGFGGTGFMTKEVLLDTVLTNFWSQSEFAHALPLDWWEWTPIGPGARRGAARMKGLDGSGNKTSEREALHIIKRICDAQNDHWPMGHGKLAPTDVQFGLCEFDKYERVRLGQGTPRSRYQP